MAVPLIMKHLLKHCQMEGFLGSMQLKFTIQGRVQQWGNGAGFIRNEAGIVLQMNVFTVTIGSARLHGVGVAKQGKFTHFLFSGEGSLVTSCK